jgi:hypothetical protein
MFKFFVFLLSLYTTLVVSNPLDDIIVVEERAAGDKKEVLIQNQGSNFAGENPEKRIPVLEKFQDQIMRDLETLRFLTDTGKHAIQEQKDKDKKKKATITETTPNPALLLCVIECGKEESVFKPNKIFFSGKGTASGSKKIPALERMIREAFSQYALRPLLLQSNIKILDANQQYEMAPQAVMGLDHEANDEEVIESMRELFLGDKKPPTLPSARKFNAEKTKEFHELFIRCIKESGHAQETIARDHDIIASNPHFSCHYALGNQSDDVDKPFYNHDLYYHSEQALMKYLAMLEHTYWEDFHSPHEVFQMKTEHLFEAGDEIYKLPTLGESQEEKLKQFFRFFSLQPDIIRSIHSTKEEMTAFPEMKISLLVSSHKKMCPLCVMSFYKRFENQSIKRMFSILIMKALAYSLLLSDNTFIPDNFSKEDRWKQFNYYHSQLGNMQNHPLLSKISMKMISMCNVIKEDNE